MKETWKTVVVVVFAAMLLIGLLPADNMAAETGESKAVNETAEVSREETASSKKNASPGLTAG